jgi:hypothetical protein
MTATMSVASEPRDIARGLIAEHHPHLLEAQVLYIFTDQPRKRCDPRVALVDHELCHCALFVKDESERPAFWRRFDQTRDTYDESDHDYRWGMRGHDIEEFGEVLYRHGFWKPAEQERYVRAVALQLVMADAEQNGVAAKARA